MKSRGEKLPKGRSYPVKPSIVERAVAESGLAIPVELTRWDRFDHAFQADFVPAGNNAFAKEDSFWVRCRAVPSARAKEAKALIEAQAIPQFIEWAFNIERLDDRSTVRRERQKFSFSLDRFAE